MTNRRGARSFPGLLVALVLLIGIALFARGENLPPKPDRYITDEAHVLDASTLESINQQLDQFERDTSNQIVVAIYPSLPDGVAIDQYAIDTFNAWQIGQAGKDNGVLLMVAINDHKLFIATGRGMEGVLPDSVCGEIRTQVIFPRFKQRDFAGGIQAGVNAIIAATKGEYKGNGSTVADDKGTNQGIPWIVIIIFIVIFILSRYASSGGMGPIIYSSGGWGGGGYGGGGGYSGGGGGGGFSGGGGSSAGGGAGGSW